MSHQGPDNVPDGAPGNPAEWDEMVCVGRIARSHGLRGDVVVSPETDFVDQRFAPGAGMWVRLASSVERVVVHRAAYAGRRLVVGFRGVSTVDEAERLAGTELRVAERELVPLAAGRFYLHQLVGCRVEDATGEAIGEVVRVDGGSGAGLLVVTGQRGEVLVPFAEELCPAVDVAGRVIRVSLPEGLLDVNVTAGRGKRVEQTGKSRARRGRAARTGGAQQPPP